MVQPYAQLTEGQIVMTGWEYLQRFDEVDGNSMMHDVDMDLKGLRDWASLVSRPGKMNVLGQGTRYP